MRTVHGDEDAGGNIDNLSGRLLNARALVTVVRQDSSRERLGESMAYESSSEPRSKVRRKIQKKSSKKKASREWVKQDIEPETNSMPLKARISSRDV